jgi:solute carrier family 25 phosphate transporter 23/24/25/41
MDGESTNAQDARIEELFRALDAEGKGHLDLDNLRDGLKRIDHRTLPCLMSSFTNAGIALKNASVLLKKILRSIDTDHDEHISFDGWTQTLTCE